LSKLAFIFPGQGSQYPGMGRELAEHFPAARRVFEEADRAAGFSLSRLCFEGPAEDLQLTENTQPAILAVSVAAAEVLREKRVRADFVAGHSLGEYSALVDVGALRLGDAVRLVRKRGQYMQEAVQAGQGAMAAMLGLQLSKVEEICREAAEGDIVSPANLNSPAQIVIAGHRGAVERAVSLAKARHSKRALMLNVSAPFHCALMKPAADRLAPELDALEFRDLHAPLVNNADARAVRSGEAAREGLKRQVTAPVRWEESIRTLRREGVQIFVEVGPGKVLSGLVRQIDRDLTCLSVEDMESLEGALAQLAPRKQQDRSQNFEARIQKAKI
jgi:[acyl-carrier-protein] S-malonyltransferase